MENLKSDPTLIKNPFVCNSSKKVRLSLDKDPRVNKGNTTYVKNIGLSNGNTLLNNELDPQLSYTIGTAIEDTELTFMDKYDYEVPPETLNKTSKVKHIDGLPLSFIQIDTEEDGIEWYKVHYPKIPDDLLPIIARYHWGEPITKKAIKNEKKKITKKLNKKGLIIENKKVSLNFD